MFCPYCGSKNEDSSAFCQQCGKPLPANPDPIRAIPSQIEMEPPKYDPPARIQVQPDQTPLSGRNTESTVGVICQRCGRSHQPAVPLYCEACGFPLNGVIPIPNNGDNLNIERPKIRTVVMDLCSRLVVAATPGVSGLLHKRTTLVLIGAAVVVLLIGILFIRQRQAVGASFATSDACQPVQPGKNIEEANSHDLNGDLKRDSYFMSGQEYSIIENGTLRVPKGVTLIIEPGARVKFGRGSKMMVSGELLACGRSNRRILFTADTDTGQPGYWQGIEFRDADNSSVVGHATFEFAGMNYHPVIQLDEGSIQLENLKFDSNEYYALSFSPESLPEFRPPITVDNGPQGWEMHDGNLEENLTWDIGQPLVIKGTLTVREKSTLTVAAGSQIKFLPDAQLLVYGKIRALGTPSQHIRITAARSELSEAGNAGSNETWSGLIFKGTRSEAEMIYVDYRYDESEETE